jgi:small GTP-binding protein
MGLMGYLERQQRNQRPVRLLMLGFSNAGKSTLLKNLLKDEWNEQKELDTKMIQSFAKQGVSLSVWDLEGKHASKKHWPGYFQEANAIVFVIDATDQPKFKKIGSELRELMDDPQLKAKSILIFANKCDTEDCVGIEEVGSADRRRTEVGGHQGPALDDHARQRGEWGGSGRGNGVEHPKRRFFGLKMWRVSQNYK